MTDSNGKNGSGKLSRTMFMVASVAAVAIVAGVMVCKECLPPDGDVASGTPEPFIYCSDIFHPAMDPDDHFDLAALFAMRDLEVRALILDGHIDRPGQDQFNGGGRIPLSQMEHITGRSVPAAVGLNVKLRTPDDRCEDADPRFLAGVGLMKRVLEESREPVTIKISTGTDLAVLFNRHPDLCCAKIKRVYFNAGHGDGGDTDEYNALLDPVAFARIFETGLPVYWNPCFDSGREAVSGHCNFFKVPDQRRLLVRAPQALSRFFSYALLRETCDPIAWLSDGTAAEVPATERWMWTPPVLAHAAGMKVFRKEGSGGLFKDTCEWRRPRSQDEARSAVKYYGYEPARVSVISHERGVLSVEYGAADANVMVFRQYPGYAEAMAECLENLYATFGE